MNFGLITLCCLLLKIHFKRHNSCGKTEPLKLDGHLKIYFNQRLRLNLIIFLSQNFEPFFLKEEGRGRER